jgi:hypothetical protein
VFAAVMKSNVGVVNRLEIVGIRILTGWGERKARLITSEDFNIIAIDFRFSTPNRLVNVIMDVQQPAISKLERRQNLELNTLRSVINALGGTIEIIVRVPDKEPILLSDYQE